MPEQVHHDAWNPGLDSRIPSRLHHRITLFAETNSINGYQDVEEASRFCGLAMTRLADLTPERMVVHELLVRVTADLSVPDGPSYEYLGLSLRGMVEVLHHRHLAPVMAEIGEAWQAMRDDAAARMTMILADRPKSPAKTRGSLLKRWSSRKPAVSPPGDGAHSDEQRIEAWRDAAAAATDPIDACCHAALAEVGLAMLTHRGRLGADHEVLVRLALTVFCQDYGPRMIRAAVAPHFEAGARAEGYRFLPKPEKRIIMNTKGASAAGKSTIRPHQRRLAESLGIRWEDFALISPDYWRKYLLDYDSLGEDYKYAGMLSGQELAMVDQKLDRYMAEKAEQDDVPHLLIDRFRFDSFMVDSGGDYQSTLLTRFGDTVFLFFVITPPHETVERAWQRGLTTQRYKAVDDLLYHNIEAYTGIPQLFFSWTATTDKTVHFEFLDNDVPLGEDPKTIAFGCNNTMTILDPVCLSRIDRYREVNIEARRPEDTLKHGYEPDYAFLRQCLQSIPDIDFANPETAAIYGRFRDGHWQERDPSARPPALLDEEALLAAIGWDAADTAATPLTFDRQEASRYTLGRWGAKI
ncbi:MAG: hypothetical protein ACON4P_09705 [Candidatus Puniceispirillales bacterium]